MIDKLTIFKDLPRGSFFRRQPHKKVQPIQKIRQQQPTNFLSVFDHFLVLALKGINEELKFKKGEYDFSYS